VCTASTPVPLAEASKVIDILVEALRDLAASPSSSSTRGRQRDSLVARVMRHLRPTLARVTELPGRFTVHPSNRMTR
jgi:hypothetical protein